MRLNWSLKYSENDTTKDGKPMSPEEYMYLCSRDLFIPLFIRAYIDLALYTLESDLKLKIQGLQTVMNRKMYTGGDQTNYERYNLWDGVSVSYLMDKKGIPVPKYTVNDRNLRVEYLKINRSLNKVTIDKYELNITKQRYTHICPLEYYNYTQDLPELDKG